MICPSPPQTTEEAFNKYLQLVISRGYFNDVVQGTPEYEAKLEKVKQRFKAHEMKKAAQQATSAATSAPSSAPAPQADKYAHLTPEERKSQADAKKDLGNKSLQAKKYNEAVAYYTEAIELYPGNAIYYSNRYVCWWLANFVVWTHFTVL